MIQGKIKTLIPLLKNMIITRLDTIEFEDPDFVAWGVEDIQNYCDDMLNLINAIYQDYIVEVFDMETVLNINLKTFTYKKVKEN